MSNTYKLALIDSRIYNTYNNILEEWATHVTPFSTKHITYNAIACHPDVFIHELWNKELIVAPNLPSEYLTLLKENNIPFSIAEKSIDYTLEESTTLNCISTRQFLLHKHGFTDPTILAQTHAHRTLNVPNAYTRCSMTILKEGVAITSDKGIEKALLQHNWEVFYFDPSEIYIEDHNYGFWGGCCGLYNNKLFTLGNPLCHKDGKELLLFLEKHDIELVPLFDDRLIDGGGVFLLGENT